ncbi:MAG: DUF6644 family protein [Phreatobacter sp.]|uniref:DUF6644 family protein n=1 Tax=Phreatobacter sp. TaxID=1966341 RepID=UPI0040350587
METLVGLWTDLGRITGVALSTPVYAAVSALHVVGLALLFGPIALVDLRIARLLRSLDVSALALLRATARIGIALAVATGVLLAAARPDEYLANPTFLAKLTVVGLGLANALAFEVAARRTGIAAMLDQPLARASALASLALWLAAIGLGRWIAFT